MPATFVALPVACISSDSLIGLAILVFYIAWFASPLVFIVSCEEKRSEAAAKAHDERLLLAACGQLDGLDYII